MDENESDGQLLAATVAGDAEAFGRFYRRHEHRVPGYAIEAAIDAARLAPRLTAVLGTLPARDRQLLELVSAYGLTPAQAGDVLGLNPNTARLRLSRARARLREALARSGEPPAVDPGRAPGSGPPNADLNGSDLEPFRFRRDQ
jgi:RNA polymerase sigma factor (sigma-70 family)